MMCPPDDPSSAGILFGLVGAKTQEALCPQGRIPSPRKKCRSFPKIKALPGGLYAERMRCNRTECHCSEGGDGLHRPYLYRRWLENGRRRRQYVSATDKDQVRAALAEWWRVWERKSRAAISPAWCAARPPRARSSSAPG